MSENLEDLLANFTELLFHGLGCIEYGDYDQAIADYTKALEFKLNFANQDRFYALAHHERGFAYIKTGNFLNAFKDFVEANKRDPVLKTRVPAIYVLDKIADIYKDHAEEEGHRAFELYFRLLEATSNIQQKQFYAPQENAEVAHYTSLHTLKNLAGKRRFRLYNAAYMNDPEEGRVFFEIMEGHGIENVEEVFYRNDEKKTQLSPAYIGSFVKVDANELEQKDELFLWRTYGKHDGQEAAGACLIYKHEGTVFAEKCGAQIGAMQQLQSKPLMAQGDHQIPEERQPRKPDLYKIVYSDENLNPLRLIEALRLSPRGCSDEGTNRGLSEGLKKLAESLKQINEHIEEEKNNNSKEKLKQLVRDLLDTIRFLFKARHYREEKEVRVVQVRYYDEENRTQESDDVLIDTEKIPPRFYLETHENFRFGEVILGPQARSVLEWKRWLKEQNETLIVKKSEINYGERYH